jgi:hypothetical protein
MPESARQQRKLMPVRWSQLIFIPRVFIQPIDGKTATPVTYRCAVHVIQQMSFQSCPSYHVLPGFSDLRSDIWDHIYRASVLSRVFSVYYLKFVLSVCLSDVVCGLIVWFVRNHHIHFHHDVWSSNSSCMFNILMLAQLSQSHPTLNHHTHADIRV